MDNEVVVLTSDSDKEEDDGKKVIHRKKTKPHSKTLSDDELMNLDLGSPVTNRYNQNEDNLEILEVELADDCLDVEGSSSIPYFTKNLSDGRKLVSHVQTSTAGSINNNADKLTTSNPLTHVLGKKSSRAKNDDKVKEKAQKSAELANKRMNKPSDCLKYITAVIDSRLFDTIPNSGVVLTQLQSSEMKHSINVSPIPNSIYWTREKINYFVNESDEVVSTSTTQEEDDGVLVLVAQEFFSLSSHTNSLTGFVCNAQRLLKKKSLTILIYGLGTFLKEQSKKDKRRFREHVAASNNEAHHRVANKASHVGNPKEVEAAVTASEIELLKVKLLLETQSSLWPVETSEELGKIITRLTKAVAERPYKEERLEQTFDFYAAEVSGNTKVNKDGHGLERLWQQQLMQFPLVALETSQAIASKYHSPLSLIKAYESCYDETEASLLLQDIPIRRHAGPLSTSRKIGPELSKKIHKFLTSKEGSTVL